MRSLYTGWKARAELTEAELPKCAGPCLPGVYQRVIECWLKAADYTKQPQERADARNRAAKMALELHLTLSNPEPGRRTA